MSRGKLKPEDGKCIQKNYEFLVHQVEAKNIVHFLFQHEVITIDDKERICAGSSQTERTDTLLTILLNAGPGESFTYFLKSLEKQYSFVLEKLQRKEDESNQEENKNTEVNLLKEQLAKALADLKESQLQCAQAKVESQRKEEKIKILQNINDGTWREKTMLEMENNVLKNQKAEAVETIRIKEDEINKLKDKQADCMEEKKFRHCFEKVKQDEDWGVPLSKAVGSGALWKSVSMFFTPIKK